MQSVFASSAPPAGIAADLKPWQKMDWPPEIQRNIYRGWADYYTKVRRQNCALHYYTKALNIDPDDFDTLYRRSQCRRRAAQTELALEDGRAAQKLAQESSGHDDFKLNLELSDTLYELSDFEHCMIELQNNTRQFIGNKIASFASRLVVVNENFQDCLGEGVGPFFSANEGLINLIVEEIRRAKQIDLRPLWKILKDAGQCDVISIIEEKEELFSPLERARRARAFVVFNQCYIQRSWIDVIFLKLLRKNPNLFLKYIPLSSIYLQHIVGGQYSVIKTFLKMLHARAPMYYLRDATYPNKKLYLKCKSDFLFRIQYQTRRTMISILRTIRRYMNDKKLRKLEKFVEDSMGDYVTVKTFEVMPWKFEFLNEVYNMLALAYSEQYRVPAHLKIHGRKTLSHLLLVHNSSNKGEVITFVFGDRSTYQDKETVDPVATRARNLINRLERRLLFSKYHIERSYLYHQIGQIHLNTGRVDECAFICRKAIDEARKCNSHIWEFLSYILMCKSYATLMKVERAREGLEGALNAAVMVQSPVLIEFIELCLAVNSEDIVKKSTKSIGNISIHSGQSSLGSAINLHPIDSFE